MSEQAPPKLPPEVQQALLATLDELRARVTSGDYVPLVLVRFNEQGRPMSTLVGDAVQLHFALATASAIIMQAAMQTFQIHVQEEPAPGQPRQYFMMNEKGQA